MAYSKHTWAVGEAITQSKMNNIESGVDQINTLEQTLSSVQSTANTAYNQSNTNSQNLSNLQTSVANLNTRFDQEASFGQEAMTQIHAATDSWNSGDGTTYIDLADHFVAIEQRAQSTNNAISNVSDQVTIIQNIIDAAKVPDIADGDTLAKRFKRIETRESTVEASVASLMNAGGTNADGTQRTLAARLNSIDGGTTPTRTLNQIIAEIDATHGLNGAEPVSLLSRFKAIETAISNAATQNANSAIKGKAFDSVDARFEELEEEVVNARGGLTDIDTRLDNIESNVSTLSNNKISTSAIANNLTTATAGFVLDARQGKELEDKKINYIDIVNDVNSSDVDKPLSANQGKILNEAISALGASIENTNDSITAYLGSGIGTTNDAANGTATAQLTDLRSRASSLETQVTNIANELSMTNIAGEVLNTTSRIDTLEENVVTIANEIGMLQNGAEVQNMASAITGATTRIDTLENDLNTATTGVKDRLTEVETTTSGINTTITTMQNDILANANAISHAAGDNDAGGLTERITALEQEPKSATEIVATLPASGDTTKDYLVGPNAEDKYFYYKWINNEWHLISGDNNNSGANSSGRFIASLNIFVGDNAEIPDENTDYFVGDNTIGYTHYRYKDNEFVRILPKGLIINAGLTPTGGLTGYTVEDTQTNIFGNFVALKSIDYDTGDNGTTLTFYNTNGDKTEFTVQGGGGGTVYSARLRNASGATELVYPALEGISAPVSVIPTVTYNGELIPPAELVINLSAQWALTNDANTTWTNFYNGRGTNGATTSIDTVNIVAKDIKTYIRVQMTTTIDEEEKTFTAPILSVSRVEMSITALNFDPSIVRTSNLRFQYRTMGRNLQKEVHFLLDGVDAVTPVVTKSHNETLSQEIPLTQSGAHTFQVYFTVDGVKSNELNYYILYNADPNRLAPLIGLAAPSSITYGDNLDIKYTVATIGAPTNQTEKVVLELYTDTQNLKSQEYLNINNEIEQSWSLLMTDYPIPEDNEHPITLHIRGTAYHTVDGTEYIDTHVIDVIVNALDVGELDLTPAGTENLVYAYTAYGRTNLDSDKTEYHYQYTAYDNSIVEWTGRFNNFNWATNGYIGDQALTISGGATHTIDVPIFSTGKNIEASETYTNPSQNGRTIEIEYEVQSATNLNDIIISCMGQNHCGFSITPQSCWLLNSNTDIALAQDGTGNILNESSIAAAYLSPNTRNHLVFVIEPWAEEKAVADNKYHQSVNIYLNGEFVNACPYTLESNRTVAADFTTNATITMGSPSCIIKLYNIKLYNRGLTQAEVLHNYETIPAATADKLARFEYNDVLTDGVVDYAKACKHFTCLLLKGPEPVWRENEQHQQYNAMPTISPYKGAPSPINRKDKTGEVVGKVESGLILTMPDSSQQGYHAEFDLQDKLVDGGYASSNNVQGTSSQKYPIHNLKIYLAQGTEGTEVYDDNNSLIGFSKSSKYKYKIPGSKGKGESTLCWKADYMSTDHANTYNANIADSLFTQSLNPDITDEDWQVKVQNTVNGIRCLLFEQNGTNLPKFVADGCLNNDKGNSKTFGLEYPEPENPEEIDPNAEYDVSDTADTVAQKWEFTNNSDDLGFFKYDGLFYPVGADNHYNALDAFESCYPDQGDLEDAQDAYKKAHDNEEDPNLNPNYNHLQILLTWVAQRANYWDETDPDIRATKKNIFRTEFTRHFNLDHVLVYYIFSQYIALCDNRVKNMFMRSDTVRKEIIKLKDGSTLFEGNSNPNADLFKEFTQINTGEVDKDNNPIYKYNMKNENQIDWEASSFAIWAPVLYDLDSCFGVENVGLLKIPYNADWQYQDEDSYLFNGHDSIFWLMFEDSFDAEIRTKAQALYNRDRGLNYNTFYQEQIVGNQNETAPAMINQDMLLKFDAPWTEGFINYAEKPPIYQTPEYKYLQRGTRAAQKRQFISQRSMLLSSKYSADEFRNSRISMRYGADLAEATLQITGNQIFYPAASFGDNKGWTSATELEDGTLIPDGMVNANETCIIRSPSSMKGQDTLFIGGAKVLTDIGDLSPLKPYEIKLGTATNLKRLILGSDLPGYVNTRTGEVGIQGLSNCALLEVINLQNCTYSGLNNLDLSSNGLIKEVYTKGSAIKYVGLPAGGVLEVLELGSNIENITIRNQSYFRTFIYQDAETNHYANVKKLWIENTPNVPIVDIVIQAMSHLDGGVRLINIDVDLGDNSLFLETITSNIAENKHLTSSGSLSQSISYPEITGKVKISVIRESLLEKVKELYPNLIVYARFDENNEPVNVTTQEFKIEYRNYDNTLLYSSYRTGSEKYIDPAVEIDPITHKTYLNDELPTKPQDAQYIYKFGSYDTDNNYIPFSGWVKEGTTTLITADDDVTGNAILIAYYPLTSAQIRSYTARWYYAEGTEPVYETTQAYGTDLSSLTPETRSGFTRASMTTDGNGYRVFKGWSRPVGKLVEDVRVYAQWETSNITNATSTVDFTALNAADIYALSQISAARRNELLAPYLDGRSAITIKMGNDFNYINGVNMVDLLGGNKVNFSGSVADARIYDGNHGFGEVFPLDTNKDFTLGIDFKMLLDYATYNKIGLDRELVLMSCYQSPSESSIKGFKLSLVKSGTVNWAIVLTWGTQSVTIDYITLNDNVLTSPNSVDSRQYCHTYRKVLVLRHTTNANMSNNLYAYYLNSSAGNIGSGITSTILTGENSTIIDTPLILGGNYNYAASPLEIENNRNTFSPAKAIVYWAKYWDTDLGEANCQSLAAWPHEDMHFYLSGYNNGVDVNMNIIANTNLSFVPAQLIGDRYFNVQNNFNSTGQYIGWGTSIIRNYYNNILYNAFPIQYRAIIAKAEINANAYNNSTQTFTYRQTNDYLFGPAEKELNDNFVDLASPKSQEAEGSWPWIKVASDIPNIYTYAPNSTSQIALTTSIGNVNSERYRFFNYYIAPNAKIFYNVSQATLNGNIQVRENDDITNITVQPGDVWDPRDYGEGIVYIYVSANDAKEGIYIDLLGSDGGGWKKSEPYELRTYSEYNTTSAAFWNSYMKVNTQGTIVEIGNGINSNGLGAYRGLFVEFAV